MIEPALADEAFLADVAAASDPDSVYLWWLGQSGFLIKRQGRHLLIDPYLSDSLTHKYARTPRPHVRMTRRVVDPGKLDFVDVVCSTHGHTDHFDAETLVPILASGATLVCPRANRELAAERLGREPGICVCDGEIAAAGGFELQAVPAAHPELGPDYLGYVVGAGGRRIYHSGDTVVYPGIADRVGVGLVDLALLPINGAFGNMDGPQAAGLARAIQARLAVPCHYEMFEFNTAAPTAFVAECERLGQPFKVLRAGERLSLAERPRMRGT